MYTNADDILIAINSGQDTGEHTFDTILQYRNGDIDQLPPHLYRVAKKAKRQLYTEQKHQVISLQGRCGSGKTEVCHVDALSHLG